MTLDGPRGVIGKIAIGSEKNGIFCWIISQILVVKTLYPSGSGSALTKNAGFGSALKPMLDPQKLVCTVEFSS
jgi:hypothetical protein